MIKGIAIVKYTANKKSCNSFGDSKRHISVSVAIRIVRVLYRYTPNRDIVRPVIRPLGSVILTLDISSSEEGSYMDSYQELYIRRQRG